MPKEPTYDELEQRIKELEQESRQRGRADAQMALFRRFTEASGQGLGMADLEGNVIYANPTLCRLMGEERSEDPIGKHVRIYYCEEERPVLENEILPAVFREGQKTAEISLLSRKGESTPTIQNVFLIRNDEGEPVCLANVITDITKRKRAEEELKRYRNHLEELVAEHVSDLTRTNEELQAEISERNQAEEAFRESEKHYRLLWEHASDSIFLLDMKGRFIDVNDATCRSLGRTREELLTMSVSDIDVQWPAHRLEALFREMVAGEHSALEGTHLRKSGTSFPVEIRLSAFDKGNRRLVLAVARDISERKRIEQALRERRNELESQLEAVPFTPESIRVSGINIEWDSKRGLSTFEGLPVAMMWIDTTLAGLMSGLQSMVGAQRFGLALQSQGRKSVEGDWQVISQFPDFQRGFEAISNIAAVAGWGDWQVLSLDEEKRECRFRVWNRWEGRYQKALGVCWGSGMLAGKLAGYSSMLFKTNCWADQTAFVAKGDEFDEFVVHPSKRSIEEEIDKLLASDEATRADMAVALQKLRSEVKERRRAEKALRQSEEKYRDLVENINDVIYAVDMNGIITYISPAVESVSAYRPEEIVGRPFTDFAYQEDLPALKKRFQQVLSGYLEPYEYRLISKAGDIRWVRTSSRPVFKGDRVVGLSGVLLDITEARRLQEQLQQAQKMEAIGTLAGGIAHDFNNILGVIIGNAELAMEHVPEQGLVQKSLEEVCTASMRARDLVRQILSFSRQADQEVRPIEISPIVEESLHLLRSTIPKTIDIRKNISCQADTVLADPTQINQILFNLCTNAAHAMEKNGGTLGVSLESAKFGIGSLDLQKDQDTSSILGIESRTGYSDLVPEAYVRLTVSDTGHGIGPEVMDRIYDPYFTTKQVGEGTGLGLSVVHGIVRACGGIIRVESEPGKGTTFEVLLPTVETEGRSENHSPGPLPKGSERILLVDDEDALAELGERVLANLGYDAVSKTSTSGALELFRANPDQFDLVITDMTMPHMTGDRLAKKLMKIRPDIPVILCTGHSGQISEKRAKAIGIRAFVMKPIAQRQMAETIRKVLDGR